MTKMSELGEKAAVSRILQMLDPSGSARLGDDCAILDMGREYLLATTDMVSQGTHFPDGSRPEDMGWHVAAINLSDIAAMGGFQLGFLAAVGLPADTEQGYLDSIVKGLADCCARYGIPVLGGDLKENDCTTLTGVALGTVAKRDILLRSGARPGDVVCLTGALGKGVEWQARQDHETTYRLLRVEPRLRTGQWLAQTRAVTSCIDTSDGLSMSLHHLSESSNVGFVIEHEKLPFLETLSREQRSDALFTGGDYELLFTVDPDTADMVFGQPPGEAPITRIGRVSDEGLLIEKDGESTELQVKGYEHFRRRGP